MAQVHCSFKSAVQVSLKHTVQKYCQLIRFSRFTESGGTEEVSLQSYSTGDGKAFISPFPKSAILFGFKLKRSQRTLVTLTSLLLPKSQGNRQTLICQPFTSFRWNWK